MSISACSETEPAKKSSNLARKASFAITSTHHTISWLKCICEPIPQESNFVFYAFFIIFSRLFLVYLQDMFMKALGIIKTKISFQWALISSQKKKITIEETGEGLFPEELISKIKLTLVTGLDGEEILRRDLTFPLNSEKLVRASLPFQLEPLLPFSLEEALVFPQYQIGKKETTVTLWATTKETLQQHLSKWQTLGIDPDHVSCQTLALARWARFSFPEHLELVVTFENLAIALDHNRVVCAMSSPHLEKLRAFLKQKYPNFEWVEKVSPFAITIGLALEVFEKEPLQLRTKEFLPAKQKEFRNVFLRKALYAALSLLTLSFAATEFIFHLQEKTIEKQIGLYSSEKTVEALRKKILLETKMAPSVPSAPTVQEILAWLSSLKTSVDLYRVSYEQGVITIEFQTENPTAANLFIKQLQQHPSFVEQTHELKWTSHSQGYKLSFPSKKS